MKPLKEVQKNKIYKISSLENLTSKKTNSGPSLYYDGYSIHDFPKKFLLMKPLKEVEKKIKKLHL